jgi:hypothetical protein
MDKPSLPSIQFLLQEAQGNSFIYVNHFMLLTHL